MTIVPSSPRRTQWTLSEITVAFRMRIEGHSLADIGEQIGRTPKSVELFMWKRGFATGRQKRRPRSTCPPDVQYVGVLGKYVAVPLGGQRVLLADYIDLPTVLSRDWGVLITKSRDAAYAYSNRQKHTDYLHRLLMGLTKGDRRQVDHINHNGLDNRRANLRVVTASQNCINRRNSRTSEVSYKGVTRIGRSYKSAIKTPSGVTERLGTYWTSEDAARAYDKAARRIYGHYALLNLPDLIDGPHPIPKRPYVRRRGSENANIYQNKSGRWAARVQVNNRRHSCGSFASKSEAVEAARRKRIELTTDRKAVAA